MLLSLAGIVVGVVVYLKWPRTYHTAKGVTIAGVLGVEARAGQFDWPQFRGPRRDGTSTETGWSPTWSGSPKESWRREVGRGASSIAVSRGRLFTASNRDGKDIVWCLSADTGQELWRFEYSCPLDRRQFEGGPAATPTVDGDRVYTLSQEGQLFCLDVAQGTCVWAVHLVVDLGGERPFWGFAGSLLVVDGKVITDLGGPGRSTVALEKGTGRLVWKAGDDKPGYSSPVLFEAGARPAVALFKGEALVAHALDDGSVLWRFPWETSYGVNASMPLVSGSTIFVSSGYGHGCALLDFASGQPIPVWESREMRTHFGSCLLHEGHIYGVDDGGKTKCMSLETGEVRWGREGFGKGALILAGGILIILSERGELVTADAKPDGYRELARAKVLSKRCWVSPAFASGLLYVKDNEGNLACLDLRG